jgi:hypothetical protein
MIRLDLVRSVRPQIMELGLGRKKELAALVAAVVVHLDAHAGCADARVGVAGLDRSRPERAPEHPAGLWLR